MDGDALRPPSSFLRCSSSCRRDGGAGLHFGYQSPLPAATDGVLLLVDKRLICLVVLLAARKALSLPVVGVPAERAEALKQLQDGCEGGLADRAVG